MTIPTPNENYSIATGTSNTNVFIPIIQTRNPTTADITYPIYKRWINSSDGTEFILQSFTQSSGIITANWLGIGTAAGTITDHAVLVGAADDKIGSIAPVSSTTYVLTSNGLTSDPSWQATNLTGAVLLNDTTGDQTITGGYSLIVGDTGNLQASQGNILAGSNGFSGHVYVYPPTSGMGYLEIAAANSSAEYTGLLINASLSASRTWTLPNATGIVALTSNIPSLPLSVSNGGTGDSTFTAYAPIVAGTTATGAFQQATTGFSTSGYVLTSNGSSSLPSFQAFGVNQFSVNQSVASTSGTYTPSSGMAYVSIIAIGGGGGGGGCDTPASFTGSCGGGGGAGAYVESIFSAATIGASQNYVIGAQGSAGSAGNNAGGSGGNTTFGAFLTAGGGGGGGSSAASSGSVGSSGSGGNPSGGIVNVTGSPGGCGIGPGTTSCAIGGNGGSAYFGGGGSGAAVYMGAAAGSAATGYGGGGGGAAGAASGGSQAGGRGNSGVIIITEYIV